MVIDLILLALGGLALVGIAVVIVRKFPLLARLNPDTLKDRQESRLKEMLIEERLRRKAENMMTRVRERLSPLFRTIGATVQTTYHRLVELEREYRKRNLQRPEKSMSALKHMNALLDEARALVEQEELTSAEEKCIEAIALDPKKEDAYEVLGEIYMQQKEYTDAKETFEYLVKLKKKAVEQKLAEEAELATAYLDLCLALRNLDSLPEAHEACTLAVQYDENNPRNLSALLDVAITRKDRLTAHRTLDKLKEVNPENQKLAELEETVSAL